MSVDLAQLQTWLTEAKQALHDLNTGCKPIVVVDQNGERVEYQRSSILHLRNYIKDLERQIADCTGDSSARRKLGPIQVWGC